MRIMLNLKFPIEPFNTYVKDGTAGHKIQKLMKSVKPEAAYFSERDGHRGATLIVDIKNASDIPGLAEPFFLTFNAEAELRICMTPEDLGKSDLGKIGKKWA